MSGWLTPFAAISNVVLVGTLWLITGITPANFPSSSLQDLAGVTVVPSVIPILLLLVSRLRISVLVAIVGVVGGGLIALNSVWSEVQYDRTSKDVWAQTAIFLVTAIICSIILAIVSAAILSTVARLKSRPQPPSA